MSKFSGTTTRPVRANVKSPVTTTGERIPTFEGGGAFARAAQSDLFLLAATNMAGEDTFYESAQDRDDRFSGLVRAVTEIDPLWIRGRDPEKGQIGFARYLRSNLQMRSASVVLACEYVASGGEFGRQVVDAVCQRPDEPAEVLGYWMSRYGRNIPMAVKRGVADAAVRLYNEFSALRYDGGSRGIRMGDVIELTHPKAKDERQRALFKFLLDHRHHGDGFERIEGEVLPVLAAAKRMDNVPVDQRRKFLRDNPTAMRDAGFSWERLAGWLPGGMDAEAWEFATSNMGVMALVRNLRNFDTKGISEETVDKVIAKITDPDEVAKARLFPYQVWSAYKNAPSDNWRRALGKTLDLTTGNIPTLDGTLVLIDTSGSMQAAVSAKSKMQRVEVAAVMAMATARRSTNVDVVIFGQTHRKVDITAGTSVLSGVQTIERLIGAVGHSTYGHTAIQAHFDPKRHKRAVMFTDDQQHDDASLSAHVPVLYTFDLAGYRASSTAAGSDGRHTLGGFSDATFTVMQVLEAGKNAAWPF